jgi:hypothetical protein
MQSGLFFEGKMRGVFEPGYLSVLGKPPFVLTCAWTGRIYFIRTTDQESVMDEEKVCEYLESKYSEGQEVCEPEKCMVCRDGKWEDTQIW